MGSAKKSTAVAAPATKAADKSLATVDQKAKALAAIMAEDAGTGLEEVTRDMVAIPFVMILQDLSPQTKKSMQGYIKGAVPGQIIQTVSQELFADVRVVPCYVSRAFIEWVPRKKGGGFVATHPANSPLIRTAVRDGAKNILPNGNELQDTYQFFCLLLRDEAAPEACLIPMKSTQLKYGRRWIAQMNAAVIEGPDGKLLQPKSYAWSYRLGAFEESNEHGAWHSWSISDRLRVTEVEVYRTAQSLSKSMREGGAKVNYDELQKHDDQLAPHADRPPADLDNEIDA